MILLIDNYDSFSYNLYQMIGSMNPDIRVIRNDEKTVEQIETMHPEAIVLSPGPGRPADAGRCIEIVQRLGKNFKILGVCLGHQAICEAFGGRVSYAKELMHGKQCMTSVDTGSTLFAGLTRRIKTARYHSLAVVRETLSGDFRITGTAEDGEVMAIEHRNYPIFGLQFHPESILTPDGEKIIGNFLSAPAKSAMRISPERVKAEETA